MNLHHWNPFLRFPRAALGVTILCCLPIWWALGKLEVRSEVHVLLEGDQRNLASYRKVRQILADAQVLVVDVQLPEVFTPEGIDTVRRLSQSFEQQPGVVDVKSLTHSFRPVRQGLAFEMVPLVPAGTVATEELAVLREWALSHPLVRDLMVSRDARHTLIMVTYERALEDAANQRAFREEVDRVLAPFLAEGVGCRALALPLIEEEVRATLRRDVLRIAPAAVALLAGVLWLTFRSVPLVVVILGNQLMVLLLLPGLAKVAGQSITVFSVMLLPLLAGVHLTLLAHVYASLQRAWWDGRHGREAVQVMLREVFKSCLFAALTTAVGLLSFLLTDVPQVRIIGSLGAIGVGLLFCITFGPGLALVLVLPARVLSARSAPTSRRVWRSEMLGPLAGWIGRHRLSILVVAAGLVGVAAFGIARLRTDIRAVEFLSRDSPTREAVDIFDQVYGGINVVQIEFDSGRDDGINQTAFLRYLDRVDQYARDRAEVAGVYSYAQLLAMMNQIWQGPTGEFVLPDSPLLIGLFTAALKSQEYPFLTALADDSLRVAYLVLRTRDMPSERYLQLLNDVLAMANRDLPPGVEVSAARGIHTILEADRRIVRSQKRTAGFTALAIGLVLLALWRSPRLVCFALAINLLSVAVVLGVAGLAGVPLNSITMMVAALALGIAVDDSVHFITHWRDCRRAGASAGAATQQTLRVKGRPILATSAALIAIFGLFWLSSFPPVVHFGLLCALAFLVALGTVLFVLPALFGQGTRVSRPS